MVWALYSTPEDMEQIESGLSETGVRPQDVQRIRAYWNGGIRDWRNAPCIPADHPCYASDGVTTRAPRQIGTDPNGNPIFDVPTCMRVIVVNHGTLADFRDLLRTLINRYPQASVFRFFEPFMGNTGGGQWYAVDPYPPAPGYFNGMTC